VSIPVAPPPGRILVVDDDADIREMIGQQLDQAGFVVTSAASLSEVRSILSQQAVDLIVLDLNLPDGDGIDLARELRASGRTEAVIMLTARGAPIDRVLGLELGADDYLTKPFEPRELLARIRNLLRRRGDDADPSLNKRTARFGPWALDLVQRRLVAQDGRLIILSSAEYRLLERFVRHPHSVLAREDLLPDRRQLTSSDRAIDLQISRLRAKLAGDGDSLILTVRNEGYVLAADVTFE
jgi:two-component system OmpR family response regulator